MLAQVTAAGQVGFDSSQVVFVALFLRLQIEREMGSMGFIITYMAAGIFGYVDPLMRELSTALMERHKATSLVGILPVREYHPLVPLAQSLECSLSVNLLSLNPSPVR